MSIRSNSPNYGGMTMKSSLTVKDSWVIVDQHIDSPLDDIRTNLMRWSLDTREAQVRAGLIALGWTPPPDPTPPTGGG